MYLSELSSAFSGTEGNAERAGEAGMLFFEDEISSKLNIFLKKIKIYNLN